MLSNCSHMVIINKKKYLRMLQKAPSQLEWQLHSSSLVQLPCWQPGRGTQMSQLGPSHPTSQVQRFGDLHLP